MKGPVDPVRLDMVDRGPLQLHRYLRLVALEKIQDSYWFLLEQTVRFPPLALCYLLVRGEVPALPQGQAVHGAAGAAQVVDQPPG